MKAKYIYFDVANTLLHKHTLYDNILQALARNDYNVDRTILARNHKLLGEIIHFPDKTSREFYTGFNSRLLYSLGIVPGEKILADIFDACTYLPWAPFDDTSVLADINIPIGIISNWDSSVKEKLDGFFPGRFFTITGSQNEGFAKPDERIFLKAIEGLDVNPAEVMYVGDSVRLDMEPAMKLGFQCFLIDREDIFPYFRGNKLRSLHELKKWIP